MRFNDFYDQVKNHEELKGLDDDVIKTAYQEIYPDEILPEHNSSILGDTIDAVQHGSYGILGDFGESMRQMGMESIGTGLSDWAKEGQQENLDTMQPSSRRDMQNFGITEGEFTGTGAFLNTVGTLPSVAAMVVPGMAGTKVVSGIGKLAGATAKAKKAMEAAERAGDAKAVLQAKKAYLESMERLNSVSQGIGYGGTNGVLIGGSTASETRDIIDNTPDEILLQDPDFKTYLDNYGSNAREEYTNDKTGAAFLKGLGLGTLSGAVAGPMFEKAMTAGKTIKGAAAKGAMTEAPQEFGEEYGQSEIVNSELPFVNNNSLERGLVGAALGGAAGGTFAAGGRAVFGAPQMSPLEQVNKELDTLLSSRQNEIIKRGNLKPDTKNVIGDLIGDPNSGLTQEQSQATNFDPSLEPNVSDIFNNAKQQKKPEVLGNRTDAGLLSAIDGAGISPITQRLNEINERDLGAADRALQFQQEQVEISPVIQQADAEFENTLKKIQDKRITNSLMDARARYTLPSNYQDKRLLRPEFKAFVLNELNNVLPNGAMSAIVDNRGKVTERTKSQNPEWYKSQGFNYNAAKSLLKKLSSNSTDALSTGEIKILDAALAELNQIRNDPNSQELNSALEQRQLKKQQRAEKFINENYPQTNREITETDQILSDEVLEEMNYFDLKREAIKLGLPTKRRKADVIEQIKQHYSKLPDTNAGLTDTGTTENTPVNDYLNQNKAINRILGNTDAGLTETVEGKDSPIQIPEAKNEQQTQAQTEEKDTTQTPDEPQNRVDAAGKGEARSDSTSDGVEAPRVDQNKTERLLRDYVNGDISLSDLESKIGVSSNLSKADGSLKITGAYNQFINKLKAVVQNKLDELTPGNNQASRRRYIKNKAVYQQALEHLETIRKQRENPFNNNLIDNLPAFLNKYKKQSESIPYGEDAKNNEHKLERETIASDLETQIKQQQAEQQTKTESIEQTTSDSVNNIDDVDPQPIKKQISKEQVAAQNQLDKDMAALGEFFLGLNSMKIVPEEQRDTFTRLVTNVMSSAFKLGYVKFKDNAKFVIDIVRQKFGEDAASHLDEQVLKGSYIAMSSGRNDATNMMDVVSTTMEEIQNTNYTNSKGQDNVSNTTNNLERDSQNANNQNTNLETTIQAESSEGGQGIGQIGRQQEPTGRSDTVSDTSATSTGKGSNTSVRSEKTGTTSSTTGNTERAGNDSNSETGKSIPDTRTREQTSEGRPDLKPLFPEQIKDVEFAEKRLDKNRGVMFTNGTGTGKTFTGLGVVKSFSDKGKSNIIIVVPGEKVSSDWIKSAEHLNLKITKLKDTKDNGQGIVVTTYANFGQNKSLVNREWDLIITDESHKLMENAAGNSTASLDMLRALTGHTRGSYHYGLLKEYKLTDKIEALTAEIENLRTLDRDDADAQASTLKDQVDKLYNERLNKIRAHEENRKKHFEAQKTKSVFLSATPFAYDKSVDYAEGFLFDYPKKEGTGYNQPDGKDGFFIENFGYRMRYNKLTAPESGVDTDLMQREFNERLKKEGALSGRRLTVDKDYSREFITVDDAVGNKIDEGLDWLREQADPDSEMYEGYTELAEAIKDSFPYHEQIRLLEAIKAKHALPRMQQHLELGRSVVLFHSRIKGGSIHPFKKPTGLSQHGELAYADFSAKRPDLINLNLDHLSDPITLMKETFGDNVVFYNGTLPKKQKIENPNQFNNDETDINIIMLQDDAGKEGISLHDTTGKKQRVLINLGLPVKPTQSIQIEGRIYRVGQMTDAIFEYFNTGTNFERFAFASKIAERSSTAENLALGNEARALKESFIDAFENATTEQPSLGQGKGGKEKDFQEINISAFQKAISYYFGVQKNTKGRNNREGKDYFATPEPLGLKMVEWAGINKNDKVLEPSAGHGAIARFIPENADTTVIEPSRELASKLSLRTDGKVINSTFENHNIINKYDAIIMNPPYGVGGAVSTKHLEKAYGHLKEGGRIVALLPDGPAANKKLDKLLYETNPKTDKYVRPDLHVVGKISLPQVTFERAGTSVKTQIVILEKHQKSDDAPNQMPDIDIQADNINDFFGKIENLTVPERNKSTPVTITDTENSLFTVKKDYHKKKEVDIWVAKFNHGVDRDVYLEHQTKAKNNNGYYSRFVKGFVFESENDVNSFIGDNPAFSRSPSTAATTPALTHNTVETIINDTMKAFPRVRYSVLSDEAQLPPEIQKQADKDGATGEIKAVYWQGKVYVVTDKFHSKAEVEEAILHETAGHLGVRVLYGKDTKEAFEMLYRQLRSPRVMRIAEKHGINMRSYLETSRDMTYEDRAAYLVDELLAHLQGAKVNEKLYEQVVRKVKEFIGAVRQALRNKGLAELAELKDSDLTYLLKRMHQAAKDGKQAKADDRPMFMTAYHGSPHKFDKFDHSKMGTGEGAQAYGWGTYLAGNKEVAEWYRESLSDGFIVDGEEFVIPDDVQEAEIILKRAVEGELQREINGLHGELRAAKNKGDQWYIDTVQAELDLAKSLKGKKVEYKGNLYEIDLADEKIEQMLDWDKPLSEQSEYVIRILEDATGQKLSKKQLPWKIKLEGGLWKLKDDTDNRSLGKAHNSKAEAEAYLTEIASTKEGMKKGEELYRYLARQKAKEYGSDGSGTVLSMNDREASLYLKSLGIPGIKYLDGTSRSKGEGNYNYVIFDEADAPIVKRNDEAIDTRDSNFKKWFGDSKVVDENGEPLVVYHGTDSDFTIFDTSDKIFDYSIKNNLGENIGAFFTTSKRNAKDFGSKNIMGVYLSINNPKVFKTQNDFRKFVMDRYSKIEETATTDTQWFNDARELLEKDGYDGVIIDKAQYAGKRSKEKWYIAFEPTQIKSATENNGDFNPDNPDIRFNRAGGKSEKKTVLDEILSDFEFTDSNNNTVEFTEEELLDDWEPGQEEYTTPVINKGLSDRIKKDGLTANYTEERINKNMREFAYPDGRVVGVIAWINPKDYIDATTPDPDGIFNDVQLKSYGEGKLDVDKIAQEVLPPRLEIDDDMNITSHEGRHRMALLANAGINKAPVTIYFRKNSYDRKKSGLKQNQTLSAQDFGDNVTGINDIVIHNPIDITYDNKAKMLKEFTGNSTNNNSDIRFSRAEPTLNDRIRETDRTLWQKTKQTLKRNLAPQGALPESVKRLKIDRDNQMGVTEIDIGQLNRQLEKSLETKIDDMPESDKAVLNKALGGDVDAFNTLKEPVQVAVLAMRKYIDNYSKDYAEILFEEAQQLLADNKTEAAAGKAALLEKIAGNIGKYVNRSYKAFDDKNWIRKVPDEAINNARNYLTSKYQEKLDSWTEKAVKAENKGNDEVAQRHWERVEEIQNNMSRWVENDIESILKEGTAFDSMEAFIKESKLGMKDTSILIKKKDIAPEIRELLGEYTDPRITFTKSATKMSRLIFNDRFLKKVSKIGEGKFLFKSKDRIPGAYKKIASGENYKPLDGYYTFPEVEEAFRDALEKDQMEDWYRKIVQVNGLVKYGKTVLSPTTAARNWMSAYFFTLANGHFNMSHMSKSFANMKQYFKHEGDMAYLKELKGNGVIYDTPYAGEMIKLLQDSEADGYLNTNRRLKDTLDTFTKFYQYGDDFWKIIGYENEITSLMKYKNLSREEAAPLAAKRIRETYPTYSMTGRWIRQLRRFPLAGTFVSFPAEIIRTSFNMLKHLNTELKDPELRPLALKRIAGLTMASGFAYALQEIAMSLMDVDDDEEEALRDMSAEWNKNSNIMPVGRDEQGRLRYFDLSFLDPYNYWKRPINAMLRDQPFEDAIKDSAQEMLKPFFGEDILFGSIMEIWNNKKSTGGKVYEEGSDSLNQLAAISNHLRKDVQPGVVSLAENIYKASTDTQTSYGKKYNLFDEGMAAVGWRVTTFDPKVALGFKSYDFKQDKRNISTILNRVLRDPNEVSNKKIDDAVQEAKEAHIEMFNKMLRLIEASKSSGLDNDQILRILTARGVSKRDALFLVKGEIPEWRPSRQVLRNTIKSASDIHDKATQQRYIERRKYMLSQ